ncbi:alpha/beta fold hydrolase [Lysinibacillus antri]|uniref:prolyl aminopeptidase n=1 Tax=Lysinibacillus antri TaxID=2498145 RepID=A0A3S0P7N9_9BACI|nr:alpha/beta hydrolase [Lysinibacillus antri]RUL55625.1 alpha/beta hydrolase [Lysinibacillus antri]
MLKKLVGGYMPAFKDKSGNKVSGAISKMEKLTLGGINQWITISGRSDDLPILLFLHGGPGSPQTGAQRKFNKELEDYYLVVNWDQRGAGKSFSQAIAPESMNMNQLLNDAHELVRYLLKRYNKNKIFLMGHSFGAALGLLFAHKYPELLYAYVGINQPIHRTEEKRSYQYALEAAEKKKNSKAIKELKSIGFPINGVYRKIEDMVIQRKWLTKFNGVTFEKNALFVNMNYMLSPHFTLIEKLTFMKRFGFSSTHLWDEFISLNFFNVVPTLNVPVFLLAGKHDRIVFADLIEQYYEFVKAADRHYILLTKSGHLACFEEEEKFNEIMIKQVLPYYEQAQEKGEKTSIDKHQYNKG